MSPKLLANSAISLDFEIIDEAIEKSEYDEKQYRAVKLSNGLICLLVSLKTSHKIYVII
jgi:secreted Zn-dependent insulinase-like peptidase